ncbi:MAG: hypothetical protein M0Q95_14130 [Porticoccaceae bacterium]|nr:hypothetical protein [Porticoccaceae bacterium]
MLDDSFFALRLIMRHGVVASIVFGVVACLVSGFLFWGHIQWFAIIPALIIGALVFILCKSYVELINVVFHMLN